MVANLLGYINFPLYCMVDFEGSLLVLSFYIYTICGDFNIEIDLKIFLNEDMKYAILLYNEAISRE